MKTESKSSAMTLRDEATRAEQEWRAAREALDGARDAERTVLAKSKLGRSWTRGENHERIEATIQRLEAEDAERRAAHVLRVLLAKTEVAEGHTAALRCDPATLHAEMTGLFKAIDVARAALDDAVKRAGDRLASAKSGFKELESERSSVGLPSPFSIPSFQFVWADDAARPSWLERLVSSPSEPTTNDVELAKLRAEMMANLVAHEREERERLEEKKAFEARKADEQRENERRQAKERGREEAQRVQAGREAEELAVAARRRLGLPVQP